MKYLKQFWPVYLVLAAVLWLLVSIASKTVTAIAENRPVIREHVFIVDAGHGGVDGGATSCTGVLESQINLEVALRLNDILNLLGYDTHMVRTEDVSIYTEGNTIAAQKLSDLQNRVKIVNERDNSILISIHQNIFADSKYYGAQVFYNSEMAKSYAQNLQVNFIAALNPGSKRNAKQAKGVYLMEHIQRPGVLIECGFLSNPTEEALLRSPEYQKKLCSVIATTFSRMLSNT